MNGNNRSVIVLSEFIGVKNSWAVVYCISLSVFWIAIFIKLAFSIVMFLKARIHWL